MLNRSTLILLFLVSSCALAQEGDLPPLDEAFEKRVLVIETSENGCYRFDVHIALTIDQQRRGLMFVREMDPFAGMLFIYRNPNIKSMWMKNTYIPLDILFARLDGQVSSIAKNTEPLSLKSIASTEPVAFVLELNAGTSDRLGIDENSRLVVEGLN